MAQKDAARVAVVTERHAASGLPSRGRFWRRAAPSCGWTSTQAGVEQRFARVLPFRDGQSTG
jgi:hypothetical protein